MLHTYYVKLMCKADVPVFLAGKNVPMWTKECTIDTAEHAEEYYESMLDGGLVVVKGATETAEDRYARDLAFYREQYRATAQR